LTPAALKLTKYALYWRIKTIQTDVHEDSKNGRYTTVLPIPLYVDNQAGIAQITSEASSQRSKHIDIIYKFLKDLYYKRKITPIHVPTKSMIADLLTKAFPTPDFRRLCALIGLVDPEHQNDVDTRLGGVLG
jgi:hypothetical protein